MARKLHIPKAAQIRGLRKAIANRKTPKQFIPSLKKRLAKLTVFILFALAASSAYGADSSVPRPTQQILASATLATACTGSAPTFHGEQSQSDATCCHSYFPDRTTSTETANSRRG